MNLPELISSILLLTGSGSVLVSGDNSTSSGSGMPIVEGSSMSNETQTGNQTYLN